MEGRTPHRVDLYQILYRLCSRTVQALGRRVKYRQASLHHDLLVVHRVLIQHQLIPQHLLVLIPRALSHQARVRPLVVPRWVRLHHCPRLYNNQASSRPLLALRQAFLHRPFRRRRGRHRDLYLLRLPKSRSPLQLRVSKSLSVNCQWLLLNR